MKKKIILFILFGIPVLLIGAFNLGKNLLFYKDTAQTKGKIIFTNTHLQIVPGTAGVGLGGIPTARYVYSYKINFNTQNNESVDFETTSLGNGSFNIGNKPKYKVGDIVDVFYQKNDPESAKMGDEVPVGIYVLITIFGLSLLLIGFWLYWKSRLKKGQIIFDK